MVRVVVIKCTDLLSYFLFVCLASQQSNQSPMSLTSDASSPRSYVSPRISTPQTNAGPLKPILSTQSVISQTKVRKINSILNKSWAAVYKDEGGMPTNAEGKLINSVVSLSMLNNVAFHLYIRNKTLYYLMLVDYTEQCSAGKSVL